MAEAAAAAGNSLTRPRRTSPRLMVMDNDGTTKSEALSSVENILSCS